MGTVGLRNERLHGTLRGDDLLNELQAKPLCKQHATRAGDRDAHGRVPENPLAFSKISRAGSP